MADPFISEVKYLGGANEDFIEIAVDEGYDVSNLQVSIYQSNGSTRSVSDLNDLTPVTIDGKDVYVIENGDATNFNGVAFHQGVALTENGTVHSFVSFDDTSETITATSGPAAGATSRDIGEAPRGSSLETTDGGQTYFVQSAPDPGNVTCLTAGTWVLTDQGRVLVEDLTPGMKVVTHDGTAKPLLRILKREVTGNELASHDTLFPVRITAGAMGQGVPFDDLLVSRQHRMLVTSPIASRLSQEKSVLVSAIRLTLSPGIYVDHTVQEVCYYHLVFAEHEIIFANGAPTESFFIGAEALKALPARVTKEIRALFPDVSLPMPVSLADRYLATNQVQKALVQRHVKNARKLLSEAP